MQILTILFILLQIYTLAASLSPPPTDEWGDYNGLDLIEVSYFLCYLLLNSMVLFCLETFCCKRQFYTNCIIDMQTKYLTFFTSSQWINAHPDGDIHTSVRIGRERPGDSTSLNGLFIKQPFAIEKGDVIAQIPWD